MVWRWSGMLEDGGIAFLRPLMKLGLLHSFVLVTILAWMIMTGCFGVRFGVWDWDTYTLIGYIYSQLFQL